MLSASKNESAEAGEIFQQVGKPGGQSGFVHLMEFSKTIKTHSVPAGARGRLGVTKKPEGPGQDRSWKALHSELSALGYILGSGLSLKVHKNVRKR